MLILRTIPKGVGKLSHTHYPRIIKRGKLYMIACACCCEFNRIHRCKRKFRRLCNRRATPYRSIGGCSDKRRKPIRECRKRGHAFAVKLRLECSNGVASMLCDYVGKYGCVFLYAVIHDEFSMCIERIVPAARPTSYIYRPSDAGRFLQHHID